MKLANFLDIVPNVFRGLVNAIRLWPLALVAWLFLASATPHIRWTYQYIPHGAHKQFVRCTYLGIHGYVTPNFPPHCPFFAIINPEQWR